jgi:hypothetical protein
MTKRDEKMIPALGIIFDVLAIPCNFVSGFFTGLAAPIAAIAGMVALVRLITGKVPYLGHIYVDDEGERHLSFKLASPEEVKDLFEEQKEEIGGDIAKMQAEIKAIIEETKAKAQETVKESTTEA